MLVLIISLLLFLLVLGLLDARVRWPLPTEKQRRYVSVAERSKGLRRD
jgi:hypothetical protein